MLVVDHRGYGSSTANSAPSPVPELAAFFRRPRTSVLAKMANLDGSRPHGGKGEVAAAADLLANGGGGLARNYQHIFEAARQVGIGSQVLPDFLSGALESPLLLASGFRSDCDLSTEIAARIRGFASACTVSEEVATRALTAFARVTDHRFCCRVLESYEWRCVFCGIEPNRTLARAGFVVATHIKSWEDSSPADRQDASNGIVACPDHRLAFRRGHLALSDELSILTSPQLRLSVSHDKRMRQAFGEGVLCDRIVLGRLTTPPEVRFVRWHRERSQVGQST